MPLKVALVSPSLNVGGAERQMLFVAASLPRDVFETSFVLLSERGVLAGEAEALGVRVHVLGLSRDVCRRPGAGCARAVQRALARYRAHTRGATIVDAWSVPAYTLAGLIRPMARVPVVIAGRRSLPDVSRTRTRFRETARWLATRAADGVVANSRAVADAWISHDRLDPSRVRVIRNAVEPNAGSRADRAKWRQAWGVSDHHLLVGCIANLRPGKGHSLILQVAASMQDRYPNLRWVLIGRGLLEAELQAEIHRFALDDIVIVDTGVTDARDVYVGFDLAVQASDSEGLPNAVLEAAAAGLPLVATDVGGTSEVINSPEIGVLVPRGDVAAMSMAIASVVNDEAYRSRLGLAAARRSQSFSVERLASETAANYLDLVAGKWPGLARALALTDLRHPTLPPATPEE